MKNINNFLETYYPNYSKSDEILHLHDLEKEAFENEAQEASKPILNKLAYYQALEQRINEAIKNLNDNFTTEKVYRYEDLIKPENKEIKQRVISKYEVTTEYLCDDLRNSLDGFKSIFDITIHGSSVYQINIDEDIVNLSGKRLMSYIYNNVLPQISKPKAYFLNPLGFKNNKVRHSNLNRYYEAPFTGVMYDNYLLDPILEIWTNKERYQDTLYDLLSEGIDNAYEAFEAEVKYIYTDEAILENISANDYAFNDNGELL